MNFNGVKVRYIVNKDEEQSTKNQTHEYNTTTGDLFNIMWTYTVKVNPKYEQINNNSFRHAILACSTVEAQERVYQQYLNLEK